MFCKSLVFFGLASTVLADIYITSPVASTSWAAGETGTITWEDSSSSSTYTLAEFGEAEVAIAVGSASSQTKLYIISPSVNFATTASIQFTVDGSIGADSDNYFIRVDSLNLKDKTNTQYPAQAFSAKFALTNMNGSFNATIQSQIDGQSTAPLGGATASKSASTSTATTTKNNGLAATGTSTKTGSAASSTATGNGAASSNAQVWLSVVFGAIVGLAVF
ncbi:hypothetical protein BDZ89DRAFT_1065356 [Hymenopellis radicata]|nr:hypothetical protein BDZ89DRAFT_1065356 [Hymenopellis radicata]